MPWQASLTLDYSGDDKRTVARFSHDGPLRILQSLYPEGDKVCHNVLVHPPGGLVGGDTLDIHIRASGDAHGLITTPGATRFYRSDGKLALQNTVVRLDDAARLEWLPMEALCYSGCIAENRLSLSLAPQAEFMGWDVTALGLPNANAPFECGSFKQHIELPGVWLEKGLIDANDHRLITSPLGLAGNNCMVSLFFLTGKKIDRPRRQLALDLARAAIDSHALRASAGATSPHAQVVVVRALAPLVEPAMHLLRSVWATWRAELWGRSAIVPRIWAT